MTVRTIEGFFADSVTFLVFFLILLYPNTELQLLYYRLVDKVNDLFLYCCVNRLKGGFYRYIWWAQLTPSEK